MKNILKKFFDFILAIIRNAIFFLFYIIAFPFAFIFVKGKTKGKQNLKKDDEARVFVANHYEVYGPFITYMHFPYMFRPWIIDKMIDFGYEKEDSFNYCAAACWEVYPFGNSAEAAHFATINYVSFTIINEYETLLDEKYIPDTIARVNKVNIDISALQEQLEQNFQTGADFENRLTILESSIGDINSILETMVGGI
jgi:hypothetical protein